MGLFESVKLFGGEEKNGGEEKKETPKRTNDGGNFMAVPGPDNSTSDEEAEILEKQRLGREGEESQEIKPE